VPPPETAGGSAPKVAEARALRLVRIPQLVGMAAAARILAGELPGVIAIDAKAFPDAKALAAELRVTEETAARVRVLVIAAHLSLARRASGVCARLAEDWLAAAHRAEGRADALDEAAPTPEAHAEEA